MKTRDSSPPLHVHVPETTHVHVHLKRSQKSGTAKTSQVKEVQIKGDIGNLRARTRARAPWVPATGRSATRDDAYKWKVLEMAYSGTLHGERDMLLRKLVEAEFDGVAVVTQLTALNESMGGVKKDKRFSKADAALLGRQQELLTKKIETFDSTNRTLRELLRECHEREIESLRTSEQRQGLLKRLVDTEAEKVHLAAKLNNKEKEANQLAVHLDFEKLRSKETENNRQAGHSKEMEQTQEQQKEEIQALLEQLEELKRQSEEDKERLKQANQTQRHRAEHSEDSARQLSAQLLEKVRHSLVLRLLSWVDMWSESWCTRHSKEVTVKSQLEVEIAVLKNQVSELTAQIHTVEEKGHQEREGLLDRLHRLTSDNSSNKLENQKLKTTLSAAEENLMQSQSKAQQLKNSVKKLESQVENYKRKVQRARSESEEYCLKLEISEKHAQEMKADLEREIEQVRRQLLGRLKELESLPERLKRSELQLREAQEETHTQERRNTEQNNTLSELRHKVEQQGCWVETFQEKNLLLVEEHKTLQQKMESIERKLEEANLQNRDMVHVIGKREETIHSTQKQLEERARECSILSKQLEQAFEDGQRQADQSLERALLKERSIQAKALDLESQLGLKRTELSQLRRSKEDMERRFQNQLKNMKERLEQSDSTNRSLQNY
ncbi:unnamed protein product, partial [Coregonus sp. 'balchen']